LRERGSCCHIYARQFTVAWLPVVIPLFSSIVMATDQKFDRSFGQWLKDRRKALDLTQRELAQRINCALVTVQKIEEGERRPSMQIALLLADQLQIGPEERDLFLRMARQHPSLADKPAKSPPAQYIPEPPFHVPNPLTPLIGRDTELTTVRALLDHSDVRLVTLVGPPGVGKSRLSIAVAHALRQTDGKLQFPHGIWFAPLAAVDNPARLLGAVAYALGLTESGAAPVQTTLVEYLRQRALLLVLDNFEQIVEAAPLVAELLIACPQVKALVTSRVPLHVRGEHEVTVEPFALPDPPEKPLATETLRTYPALALFEARVQAFKPAFRLDAESAHQVIEICTCLDGLPLAIELAAARLRQFSLTQLAEHLQRPLAGSLNLLTGGPRDLPARHQTLRDAIAWSYNLLPPSAQRTFARLGVFVGGFDYRAASAVAGDERLDPRHPSPVLHADLQSLLDQNLMHQREEKDHRRFFMLETIRAFALEQSQRMGQAERAAYAHAHYFLTVAETAARYMQDARKKEWLDHVEREHDNLLATLKWLVAHEAEAAMRLAAALREFWYTRGYFSEGRAWLAQVLALEGPANPARAGALLAAGQLAQNQGEYALAQEMLAESIALFRRFGDLRSCAVALREQGWVLYNMHRRPEAITQFEESLSLFRTLGDQAEIATVLVSLVHIMGLHTAEESLVRSYLTESLAIFRRLDRLEDVAFALSRQSELETMLGDYTAAINSLAEALALLRELGAKRGIAWALEALGDVERLHGRWASARNHLDEALSLFQELGDKDGVMITLHHLAQLERVEGNLSDAVAGYRQCLALCQTLDNKHMTARCLAGLGGVALAQGQNKYAVQLLSAAQTLFDTLPPFLPPGDQAEYDKMLQAAQATLSAEDFTHAWNEGAVLTTQQAVEFALAPSAA
jgi:predicted ATPase/transcriptional regulator with XRE-family HTH domain